MPHKRKRAETQRQATAADFKPKDEASFSLAKHVISHVDGTDRNLVFSPLSIHILLAMTAAGSNGPTREQILGLLKSDSSEELHAYFSWIVTTVLVDASPLGGPILHCANGLWVDQTLCLKPDYRDLLHNSYRAVAEVVDFKEKAGEVRKEVNAWGKKTTKGTIKQILPSGLVGALTRCILANAVYFKGKWKQNFNTKYTKDDDFYLLNGSSVRAPFMTSWKKQYLNICDGFKVLKMPYKQGEDKRKFSMHIFLPDAKDGLPALAERILSDSGFVAEHEPRFEKDVDDFRIPKFKIVFGFDASNLVKTNGSELSEIVGDSCLPLEASRMYQHSFIEVNEEGTEVAALSLATKATRPCKSQKVKYSFVADHPFMFVIREDKSGVVLFIGQLLRPSLK